MSRRLKSAGDWLVAALARALLALLGALPPGAASNLGGFVARTIGPLLPVSRVAHDNLAAALPELDAAARARVVRGVWDNLGRTAGEFPHLGGLRQDAPEGPGWKVDHPDRAAAIATHEGPVICMSAHIGNWEMMAVVAAAYDVRLATLYRAASNPAVDRLIVDMRRRSTGVALPMFPKGGPGARQALGHLMRGGCLGLLVDQKLNDGVEALLFGMPAMTAPALAAFALRLRCPVIPMQVVRTAAARFRIEIEPALALPDSGDRAADIRALTQTMNDVLERWIRRRPDAWLWLHRRWPKNVVQRTK